VKPITAYDVHLHLTHRLGACLVAASVAGAWWITRRRLGPKHLLTRSAIGWLGLVGVQFGLGAATVWTGKPADLATAHVAVGSLILAFGGVLTAMAFRLFAVPGRRHLASAGDPAAAPRPNDAVGQPAHP
jgi:heme A synthase